jgi:hypothetical protein
MCFHVTPQRVAGSEYSPAPAGFVVPEVRFEDNAAPTGVPASLRITSWRCYALESGAPVEINKHVVLPNGKTLRWR